jgi:hypothetical protein
MGSQQYPARGLVLFASGTDLGRFSTFSWSVFKILKDVLLTTGMLDEAGEESGTILDAAVASVKRVLVLCKVLSPQRGFVHT